MCHRQRPTLTNLFRKEWHHATAAAQDISKPNNAKQRGCLPIHPPHETLGKLFGGSHDTRRIHGLIR